MVSSSDRGGAIGFFGSLGRAAQLPGSPFELTSSP